jgi:hypothetical protein
VTFASRTFRRPVALLLAGLLAGSTVALVGQLPASAAPGSFTVDDPDDAVDLVPDGVCETATGTCTLRAAIQEAIAHGGDSEIHFAPSADTSALTLGGVGGAEVGDLDVPSGITIHLIGNETPSGATTMVKADQLGDRHLRVHPGGTLELRLVLLAGGSTSGDGGAILNEGTTSITNAAGSQGPYVALAGNQAGGWGGGIANAAGAELRITNQSSSNSGSRVDVTNNSALLGGGAIANDGGSVTIKGSTGNGSQDIYLDNNSSSGDGGGIRNTAGGTVTLGCRAYVRHSTAVLGGNIDNVDGQLTLVGSALDGGSAAEGAGLRNADAGTVVVAPDVGCLNTPSITSSVATGDGGGIWNRGALTVQDAATLQIIGGGSGRDAGNGGGAYLAAGSLTVDGRLEIDGTSAEFDGGGLAVAGGAFATGVPGSLRVTRSTAGGNGGGVSVTSGGFAARAVLADNSAGGRGGGLAASGPVATLHHSAVLRNLADRGAGVDVTMGVAVLENTTIASNTATSAGGAVRVDSASVVLRHVTAADNTPDGVWANTTPQLERVLLARNSGADCAGSAASSGDLNVFDDATCVPTGADLSDPDRFAQVAALLDGDIEEGDRESYGLAAGHPAIDHVADGGCGTPSTDQLGTSRPVDGDGDGYATCDAGAIEADRQDAPHAISGTVLDEATGRPLRGICVYAANMTGDGDDTMTLTDATGRFRSDVVDGEFLMAFFAPNGVVTDPDHCGESGIATTLQPEWYRNVPIRFEEPDDPDSDDAEVIFPDLADITPVVVDGADVAGIDVCLGASADGGGDAPCGPGQAGPEATPGVAVPSAPDGSSGADGSSPAVDDQALGSRQGAGSGGPSRLAFTGGVVGGVWLGAALLALGLSLADAARRRRATRFPSSGARR